MEIRKAEREDAYSILEIISQLNNPHHKFSLNEIEEEVAKKRYYVATDDGKIIGAMALRIADNAGKIETIASRKKGAGSLLIRFAEEKCKDAGAYKLWCWSLARYNAKGFYEKMGFEESFLLKKQVWGEDCYLFGKVISN